MTDRSSPPIWRKLERTRYSGAGHDRVPLMIVGAGPVGLTLALDLAQKGQKVLVIDSRDFVGPGSKAICFSKQTLDIWNRLGIGDQMVEKGVIWNVGKVFAGDSSDPLYEFDLLPLKDQKNPAFINLQQYHAEDILIEAAELEPNIEIRWGHEVTQAQPSIDSATVTVRTQDNEYRIDSDWLLACDGNKSPIRNMLGLDFEGRVFEDNFLIADVKFQEERPSERWFWFDPTFNPGQSALLHKQPDDVWRLDFQLGWNIDREACIKPENVEPYVRGMIGEDVEFSEEWYSVYTFQCRRMKSFVHGRVIFVGDSAHLVSPFGARGCNGGAADANNLSWKLDLVLKGEADRKLIETYDYEAVVTADENILNSTRSTDFITPKSPISSAFRDAVLELAVDYEFARPFVNSGRLSTAVSYPASPLNTADIDIWEGGILPGSPVIDAPLDNGWLLDELGDDFVLLGNKVDPDWGDIRVVDLAEYKNTQLAIERFALPVGGIYLIRPDQYVAARWHDANPALVTASLNKAKGSSHDTT